MQEKIKVIAFGIGTSAKDYLKNYRDEFNILALSDWDTETHGTVRYDFNIIDPNTFDQYEYDKILILSYYTKEIIQQLAQRVGIEPSQIIVPPKYKIKGEDALPFKDSKTKLMAEEMLTYFSQLMEASEINLFLEFGTLLGLIRDGKIIDWDDDIDFSVNDYHASRTANVLIQNYKDFPYSDKVKWTATARKDKDGNIWYISLNFENKDLSSFIPFEIAFGVRKVFDDKSVCMRGRYISCNKDFFSKYDVLEFKNTNIKIPHNSTDYLNFIYGDWNTPRMYTFGEDYGSLDEDFSYEYQIDVEEIKLF